MAVLSIALCVTVTAFMCWLLFALAVHVLPFFVAVNVGMAAYGSGAGLLGAPFVGVLAGGATLAIGQLIFAAAHSPLLRGAVAFLFALPAAFAGYHAVHGLARLGVPSEAWGQIFAVTGALAIGGTAWANIAAPASPAAGRGISAGPIETPLLPTAKDGR